MPFVIKFKNQDLVNIKEGLKTALDKDVRDAIENLAQMTLAHATDLAREKLKTRREMFEENLELEQITDTQIGRAHV